MDVERVQLGCLGGSYSMQGHLADLELMFQIGRGLLRLLFSILLQYTHHAPQSLQKLKQAPLDTGILILPCPSLRILGSMVINKQNCMSAARRNSRNRLERYQIAIDPQSPQEQPQQKQPSRSVLADSFDPAGISSKELYLSTLQEQIELLRTKIARMEEEDSDKMARRTITRQQEQLSDIPSHEQATNLSRKSQAGRIYLRASTPSSSKNTPKPAHKDQESSYYKWRPQIEERERQIASFVPERVDKLPSATFSHELNSKAVTNYRVKHNNTKSIVEQKMNLPFQDRHSSNKKFKTEKILSDNQEGRKESHHIIKEKTGKDRSVKQKTVKEKEVPEKPEVPQEPEELKQVFLSKAQWEIQSIHDDFTQKILNKLQIPPGFPLQPPKPTQTIEQLDKISVQVYKLFNIAVGRCKQRLVVRKFKNGVYFQMKPNKNIVWYYSGAFYFGDWDTDLPSEAEKDGFGFQYIPGKYFYLGNFKSGARNGKGTIRVLNPSNPTDANLLAYDGEWFQGKPHGHGYHIDEIGNRYMGAFQLGGKTGKAVVLNQDGLYYEGELIKGLKNGQGEERLVNDDKYQGSFKDALFEGIGTYTWKNSSVYTGQFVGGRREGKGVWRSYNGDTFEGTYSNDLKNGWGKFTWKNGEIYQGEFKDDIRNGKGSYRHPNGKLGTYFWIDGHIDHKIETEDSPSSSKLEEASTHLQQSP